MENIKKDSPKVKAIDIVRDLRDLLRDESSSIIEHSTESTQCDILELSSYSDYVQENKKIKMKPQITNALKITRTEYSKEDDNQIRNLLADIDQGANKLIWSCPVTLQRWATTKAILNNSLISSRKN